MTSRTQKHWDRQYNKFTHEFSKLDLGSLEDVRPYVEMHSWDNAGDVVVTAMCRVAIGTARSYIDDADFANETFDSYR